MAADGGRTSPGRLGALLGGGRDDSSDDEATSLVTGGVSLLAPKDVTATLVLADGTRVTGVSFGAPRSVAGEVVFNTGMVGYPEALSDPSYRGQILVLTYPLIGNYGVPSHDVKDKWGLPKFFESDGIHITGLIVSEYSAQYSHWAAKLALGEWLRDHDVPALSGVDTRAITKLLRESGTMLGKIEFPDEPIAFDDPNARNLVAEVSTKVPRVFNAGATPRIAAVDCGIKYNIIRYLANQGVELTVVPYDHDFEADETEWDGVFLSNGPGNPEMAAATIVQLSKIINASGRLIPVFGICLGNQLLALAAGAKTYKMKYGNRGMNQPCIDMRTTRCYITPQNHGFAVDDKTLPDKWQTLFMNANDFSNEGVVHVSKPFFGVQFHPEARGGPTDTDFLFKLFLEHVRGNAIALTTVNPSMYIERARLVRKVLLLGSGGLSIGQAGEFDYSGSQAIKALKEEGIEVVLINPNIATVQTGKGLADSVYFLPVTREFVLRVIKKERPDAILISMGGQTALNVGLELHDAGDLEKYNVRVLGTPVSTIVLTEDREAFANTLAEIDEKVARSLPATTVEGAVEAAATIGYPVLVRAAFALGGMGSGFADDEAQLRELVTKAFATSDQVLIDQDLRGWKEVEYEVVRDCNNNCITVCNMENFDPLGVHTGDSIVVAPSQTLSNSEYFRLRQTALKVVRHLGVVGECNIQYALNPESEEYCIIEVNARLSRSSALASKATGYPLAYVATKLSLGVDLVSIKNSVTRCTTACFEPALDYCVVKMPRWDLRKFAGVSTEIGSSMKSVGEVMAIARSFEEALQKAMRMVDPTLKGFEPRKRRTGALARAVKVGSLSSAAGGAGGAAGSPGTVRPPPVPSSKAAARQRTSEEMDTLLRVPSDTRLLHLAEAFAAGYTVERVHDLTKIDVWFLSKLKRIDAMGKEAAAFGTLRSMPAGALRLLKQAGFSDVQIAERVGCEEAAVRRVRLSNGITPCVKQIDTLAAEFPAQTNYLYMTYNGTESDVAPSGDGVMVLGCGPYCIGSSVEFDWCAVSCVRALRASGHKAIVVNYNPETVSTDFDESDRLYFEELSLERVLDIYDHERAAGVIISVGGQIPNNLAIPLHRQGVNVLGTSPTDIDTAEDRNKFSQLLDRLGIDQPDWAEVSSVDAVLSFVERVGYPVLVRPSYVLSGAAMRVAADETQLRSCLRDADEVSSDHPIVVSKFILNAKEVEFDAVAKNGRILNYAISEHVENAGVHSGDATLVLPAQKLYVETIRRIKLIAGLIARALKISGPFNMQFISRDNEVKVIECNLRASRTFPFISKTFDFNFIALATRVFAGLPVKPHVMNLLDHDFVAVKAPMFSFSRLSGADPTLGVEMASTGEVACFGRDLYEAFLKALLSAGFKMPTRTRNILVSVASPAKANILEACAQLSALGYNLFATAGTHRFLVANDVEATLLRKPTTGEEPNVMTYIKTGQLDLVINAPGAEASESVTDGYLMRRGAVDFGVSLIQNIKCAQTLATALTRNPELATRSIQEYYLADGVA